jgi:hypothetical protein
VQRIDMASGHPTDFPIPGSHKINAVGYNVNDNYFYGWDNLNHQILRIDSDGSTTPRVAPPTLPTANASYIIGDVDENGHYWLYNEGTGFWYQINLANMEMVGTPTAVMPTMNYGGADWAFVPGTDTLYRVTTTPRVGTTGGDQSFLVGFNRTTHQWSQPVDLGNLGGSNSLNLVGAVFADASGRFLYASYNYTGEIWRIDVRAHKASFFSNGPASHGNDGARCINAHVHVDFGDAPARYGTLLENNGPRHSVPGYDGASHTAPLMLGSRIDIETDNVPGIQATGDDTTGVEDEATVADRIVIRAGQTMTVPVTVTNNTGQPATLAGWIDLDGSGAFDPGELKRVTIPASSGTRSHNLVFPAATEIGNASARFRSERVTIRASSGTRSHNLVFPAARQIGNTYARFRLFPGEVTDLLPTGTAAAGEVEDYLFTVTTARPTPSPRGNHSYSHGHGNGQSHSHSRSQGHGQSQGRQSQSNKRDQSQSQGQKQGQSMNIQCQNRRGDRCRA